MGEEETDKCQAAAMEGIEHPSMVLDQRKVLTAHRRWEQPSTSHCAALRGRDLPPQSGDRRSPASRDLRLEGPGDRQDVGGTGSD